MTSEALMRDVTTRYEKLTAYGFGTFAYYYPKLDAQERQAKFAEDRAELFNQRSLEGFAKARNWLRQFPKLSSINRRGTSYGLKHVAEPEIGYVTNGVFIAAAIAEGFTIARTNNGPNAWLNIASAAWRPSVTGQVSRLSGPIPPRAGAIA